MPGHGQRAKADDISQTSITRKSESLFITKRAEDKCYYPPSSCRKHEEEESLISMSSHQMRSCRRTEQQRLQGEEALFQISLSFILHPPVPLNPVFSLFWACVIDNQNRKILLRAESDFIFRNNSLKFQMSLCHLVWLRAIQTRSVSNENLLY